VNANALCPMMLARRNRTKPATTLLPLGREWLPKALNRREIILFSPYKNMCSTQPPPAKSLALAKQKKGHRKKGRPKHQTLVRIGSLKPVRQPSFPARIHIGTGEWLCAPRLPVVYPFVGISLTWNRQHKSNDQVQRCINYGSNCPLLLTTAKSAIRFKFNLKSCDCNTQLLTIISQIPQNLAISISSSFQNIDLSSEKIFIIFA